MTDRRRIDEAAGLLSLTRCLGSALAIAIGPASYLAVSSTKGGPPPTVTGVSNDDAALGGQAYVHAVQILSNELRRSFETATHASTVQGFASTMRMTAIASAVLTVASATFLASGRVDRRS